MANIKFILSKKIYNDKSELLVRFYSSTFDLRAKTGIFVYRNTWNDKQQRVVVPRFVNDKTKYIIESKNKVESLSEYIFEQYTKTNCKIDKIWFSRAIAKFLSPENEQGKTLSEVILMCVKSKNISKSTQKQYNLLKKIVDAFCEKNGRNIYIKSITTKDIEEIKEFSKTLNLKKKIGSSVSLNSQIKRLHILKSICIWALKNDLTDKRPFDKISLPNEIYGTPYFLTIEERNHIYNFDGLKKNEKVYRDIFVFQCLVGCRVGDIFTLKKGNITSDGNFLQYIQEKVRHRTGVMIRVPLVETAKDIIKRYSDSDSDYLFKKTEIKTYNINIKNILKKAGINRNVVLPDKSGNGEIIVPIYEVASSHLARRTFIANLYKKVKSERIVSSMTGHVDFSRSFSRYSTVDDEMKSEVIKFIN